MAQPSFLIIMSLKIAIVVREETARTCIGKGCLKAFFNRKDAFARYAGIDIEIAGFCSIGGSAESFEENINTRIDRFKKSGIDVVHVSTCNRSRNPLYEEMVRRFAAHFEVVGYTHGPEKKEEKKNAG